MKYIVQKREIHTVDVEVDAQNPLDALDKVINGEGDEVEDSQQYASTIDPCGLGILNQYQWRVFGPGLDQHMGLPAKAIDAL